MNSGAVKLDDAELTALLKRLLEHNELSAAANLGLLMTSQSKLGVLELLSLADRLTASGYRHEAVCLYEAWLAGGLNPLSYVAYFNLAILLSDLQEFARSERAYRQALAVKPDFVQAALNLGTLLERVGRKAEALSCWQGVTESFTVEAVTLPLYLHALNNRGRLLEGMGRYEEAEATLKSSLLLDGNQPDVVQHWVHLRQKQCRWPVYCPLPSVPPDFMVEYTSPLAMLSASDDPMQQLTAARTFVRRKVRTDLPRLSSSAPYGHRRLRIGYLSSDFCLHPVSLLTVPLYELHDRDRFEVYAFSWSREDGSALRARVVNSVDKYVPIASMSDEDAARCIFDHQIDILIDLQGLTSGARPNILSYRPAPLQIAYLGYPGTTGLPCIDYVLADRYVLPEALVPFFSEKPLYLPHTFQISDDRREVGVAPSRQECGLPDDGFVFCSFNNNFKFSEEFFRCWMRILHAVPNSVLWLLADNQWARQNMCSLAVQCGVAPERLVFAQRVAPPVYLARYQLADLFLDTSPFNAGTTANDALWMGLPLLTCPGHTFASRMAGSLLTTLGLPELICPSLADYEAAAIRLAQEPARLGLLKTRLAQARQEGLLFDSQRFMTDYERVLCETYQAHMPASS